MNFKDNLKQNPDSILVINSDCRKVQITPFVFNFPLFCTPLGGGRYEIETDLVFGDNKIRRMRFPRVQIIISNNGVNLQPEGDPVFELLGEVKKGRTTYRGDLI